MTRETKIGLLVGLAFIIVVGILLSDQVNHATDPPPAPLGNAGSNVRMSAGGPGISAGQREVTPGNVTPHDTIQTNRDLDHRGVTEIRAIDRHDRTPTPADTRHDDVPAPGPGAVAETRTPGPGSTTQPRSGRLQDLFPDDLVPVGRPRPGDGGTPTDVAANTTQYKAQEGDNLSRMAGKLLGANTKANRDAIVKLNASLAADPNKIIVGQTYNIPAATAVAGTVTPPTPAPAPVTPAPAPAPAPAAGDSYYVTKQGDTLWKIAVDEVGSSSAIAAIKELNKTILNGGDTIRPNMKLRLPARMVASATR